jgi:uncharacterized SAM-binding protein YcdF (DUF218 family)
MVKSKVSKRRSPKFVGLVLAILAMLIISIIPVRLAITLHQVPMPQAIFVLGGSLNRMEFAGRFWQSHSNLDIWVSDEASYIEERRRFFQKFGVPNRQLRLDGRATDTVTNFTTLVDDFKKQNLQHIYLITSDYHMRRSRAIATIVFGSRGIVVTPLAVPSTGERKETLARVLRDGGRSILWVVSGKSGARFNPRVKVHSYSLF